MKKWLFLAQFLYIENHSPSIQYWKCMPILSFHWQRKCKKMLAVDPDLFIQVVEIVLRERFMLLMHLIDRSYFLAFYTPTANKSVLYDIGNNTYQSKYKNIHINKLWIFELQHKILLRIQLSTLLYWLKEVILIRIRFFIANIECWEH